ncbi:MAG: T9SS type A sorting domain-containing protein [Calditrichaeota bacterium]|nr:T9SS type A sorting domain-containing protein [Calditrichota bacterium]
MKQMIRWIWVLLVFFVPSLLAQALFQETFSEGTLDNVWYPGFNANGKGKIFTPKPYPDNPSGDGWVGWMSTARPDTGMVASCFAGDPGWSDFYFEAMVYLPAEGGTPFGFFQLFGLEFRVDSSGNTSGYQFVAVLNPNSMVTPRFRFRKRPKDTPAQPVVIHEWKATDYPELIPDTSGWYKMAVNVVGDQFWFYFNDQELPGCPYTDTTSSPKFDSGFIGFYAFHMNFNDQLDSANLYVDDVRVTEPLTQIDDAEPVAIEGYRLEQNYPNPFNPTTTISFTIPRGEWVNLEIYNNLGENIRTLVAGRFPAGTHSVRWDGRDDRGRVVPAGIYYYRLKAGDFVQARKMLLAK